MKDLCWPLLCWHFRFGMFAQSDANATKLLEDRQPEIQLLQEHEYGSDRSDGES